MVEQLTHGCEERHQYFQSRGVLRTTCNEASSRRARPAVSRGTDKMASEVTY